MSESVILILPPPASGKEINLCLLRANVNHQGDFNAGGEENM